MSKYIDIYQDLVRKIENQVYRQGSLLPGEYELMAEYQVSRDTIRKALALLSNQGYIQKARGKGSIVLASRRYEFNLSGLESFKEVSQRFNQAATKVTCFEKRMPEEWMAKKLSISLATPIYYIERVREIDHEKIILDTDILNAELIPGLTEEHAKDSIYHYIEHELGLGISFAHKEITCQSASHHDRECLDLQGFDFVIHVESFTYLNDARCFQWTSSRHRPDKFRFKEFSRRQTTSS